MARNGSETYYNEADKSLYYKVVPAENSDTGSNTTTAASVVTTVMVVNASKGVNYNMPNASTTTSAPTTMRPLGLAKTATGSFKL